jgi:hypothetical protein
VVPALVDFHTPPDAAATNTVAKLLSTASISVTRPDMFAGPMLRHCRSANRASSPVPAACADIPGAAEGAAAVGGLTSDARATSANKATTAKGFGRISERMRRLRAGD